MNDWENEIERSGAGDPIHRYEQGNRAFEFAPGDDTLIAAVSSHIEKHLGTEPTVFHEVLSDLVHVDVHISAPTSDRACWVLTTSGMAERPMKAPDAVSECEFAEVYVCLPPHWPGLSGGSDEVKFIDDDHPLHEPENYWPIHMLKSIARLPHEYETWLWGGHTVPNGDPAEPFADNTGFCCMALLPGLETPAGFDEMRVGDRDVAFFALWPLYKEEMELKLTKGMDALLERFERAGITEVIDVNRPNVCAGGATGDNRWWQFWK